METLTVADLAALLTAMQSVPRMRGQAATKEKLLFALREAMEAQPAHADQQKVSMIFSACGKPWRRIPQKTSRLEEGSPSLYRQAATGLPPARGHAST